LISKSAVVIWSQSVILRVAFSCLFHIYFLLASLRHLRRFCSRCKAADSFQFPK